MTLLLPENSFHEAVKKSKDQAPSRQEKSAYTVQETAYADHAPCQKEMVQISLATTINLSVESPCFHATLRSMSKDVRAIDMYSRLHRNGRR